MLDELKEFYDPHPGGIAGALAAIPEEVKRVADQLNGKTFTLKHAVEMIQQAAPNGKVGVAEYEEFIELEIVDGNATHIWCVICYKNTSGN